MITVRKCLATLTMLSATLFGAHEDGSYQIEANGEESIPVYVKVLVAENIEGALIDVRGGYKVYNPENGKQLSSGFKGKKYYLQTNTAGLKWGEGYPGIHQIKIVPANQSTSILVDGIQYRGYVEAYDINSKIQLVNEVDVEDYLRSILSHEFATKKLSPAVYDAIAIAMRTHVYSIVARGFNPFWDIHAKEVSYLGEGQTKINPDMERAILATKGLIMTFQDRPFCTGWTENSGGKTANYESIYRKKGIGPEGILVGYAQKERGASKWKCTLSNQELAKKLKMNRVDAIDLYQDPTSKKVYAVRFSEKKHFVELTYFEFQKLLGESRILSTDFSVKLVKDDVLFEGYGKGTGVGVCLFTAEQMAKNGNSMPQILAEFYPSTHIVKLSRMPASFKKNQE